MEPLSTCPTFHEAIELIGRRWSGVVLQALLRGCRRFSEIRTAIPDITDAMLAQRLRDLEDAGLVERAVTGARPVEIRYGLTEVGAELSPVIDAISAWGARWAESRRSVETAGEVVR